MQDPAAFQQLNKPQLFPDQEQLRCPRCDSINTKFCYYNNYNLSQPRHFCKSCKRYWTKGGTLRNIPIGGASRKNTKRSSNPSKRSSSNPSPKPEPEPEPGSIVGPSLDVPAGSGSLSFTSLLTSDGHFGNLLEGLSPNGELGLGIGLIPNPGLGLLGRGSSSDGLLGGLHNGPEGDYGWPDLAIHTPRSRFQ